MRHYTKRTLVLCLASLITVVGAFGAENYKNNLMSLKINNGSGGYISITAYTEKPYNIPIKTLRQDANTYVLLFPETECEAKLPKLTDYENIESIGIATFPYTKERDGYTKITVKTLGAPTLKANSMLYIPQGQSADAYSPRYISDTQPPQEKPQTSYWASHETTRTQASSQPERKKTESIPASPRNNTNNEVNNQITPDTALDKANVEPVTIPVQNYSNTGTPTEHSTVLICILVLIMLIGFIMMISKDKMAGIVGDNNEFDIDENKDENKKSKKSKKTSKIRKTINTLDKTYKTSRQKENQYQSSSDFSVNSSEPDHAEELAEDISPAVVVDLDTLYQEKTQQKEPETDDLAVFLNEFTFDEETETVEEYPFNEELYQEIINKTDIEFTPSDIERIGQLLQIEITQETLNNLNEFIKTEEKKPKALTKSQVLENLLATYSISQNIEFSKEDVDVIKKLMDVELDKNFITDLTTNPNRVKEVEKELKQNRSKPHRSSEIITLNVKNLLPDLSLELKKQGDKPLTSEVKPTTVYFSEGYEVNKLSVSNELSDISTALKTLGTNEHRPSDFMPIVENGYEYSTLSIKDELPDLADVKAHPDKYADKKAEKIVVDENALLKSISNVTFKPFYTDVQQELNKFENFEIINPDSEQVDNIKTQSVNKIEDEAERLLKLIETQRTQRALKKKSLDEEREFKKELLKASKKEEKNIKDSPQIVFEHEGKKYILLKTVPCSNDSECNLAQSENGYSVFGYINGKRTELKHYDALNTTNMQVRTNEKDSLGNIQYLVKIGIHKFLFKLANNSMEFIMDLC